MKRDDWKRILDKTYISRDFDKADREFFGLDKEGRTSEMAKADEDINNMRQLQKDAEAYAACRRGEIL